MMKLKFSMRKPVNVIKVNRPEIFLTFLTSFSQKDFCEIELGKKELFNALKSKPNN